MKNTTGSTEAVAGSTGHSISWWVGPLPGGKSWLVSPPEAERCTDAWLSEPWGTVLFPGRGSRILWTRGLRSNWCAGRTTAAVVAAEETKNHCLIHGA